jgi:tripartite-type tricarboxylate transporter receptor subunit TctC
MMGCRQVEQAALFYEFSLERHVPADHLLRSIDRFVEFGELRRELAAFYSTLGRPSIDPELMIRRTASEFISYAKANPAKINMATAGNGSVPHVAGAMFESMAGVNLVTVGYRGGGPALVDLLAGRVQVMFEPTLSTLPYIRSGKLRALAVTSATRSPALPDVPVLADFIPGYEVTSWFGIGGPKNTPIAIIDKLNSAITASLDDPEIKRHLGELGGVPMPMTPAEFGKLIADETEKWGKVIRASHIKLE